MRCCHLQVLILPSNPGISIFFIAQVFEVLTLSHACGMI
jgi:hypothetical protein